MAEIKISDLSVGDWVAYNGKKYRIKEISSPYASVTLWGNNEQRDESIVLIEPIFLSTEILQKNGLEYVDDDNDAVIFLSCDLFWSRLCVGDTFWRVGIHTEDKLDAVVCDVRDVHQLQHALRLAGVEKEIEI